MPSNIRSRFLRVATIGISLSLSLTPIFSSAQTPVGTSITHQGSLQDIGEPASGAYDFEFALFDADSAGTQIGATLSHDDVAVLDGLYNVALDFGAGVFAGEARWLEIRVRRGAATGAYTTLTPRQELMPAPYALHATTTEKLTAETFSSATDANGVGVFETFGPSGNVNVALTSRAAFGGTPDGGLVFVANAAGEERAAMLSGDQGAGEMFALSPAGSLNALIGRNFADGESGKVEVYNASSAGRVRMSASDDATGADTGLIETFGPNGNVNVTIASRAFSNPAAGNPNNGLIALADASGDSKAVLLTADNNVGELDLLGANGSLNIVLDSNTSAQSDQGRIRLFNQNSIPEIALNTNGPGGQINIFDTSGDPKVTITGNGTGVIQTRDPNGNLNVSLTAGPGGNTYGSVRAHDPAGNVYATMETDDKGGAGGGPYGRLIAWGPGSPNPVRNAALTNIRELNLSTAAGASSYGAIAVYGPDGADRARMYVGGSDKGVLVGDIFLAQRTTGTGPEPVEITNNDGSVGSILLRGSNGATNSNIYSISDIGIIDVFGPNSNLNASMRAFPFGDGNQGRVFVCDTSGNAKSRLEVRSDNKGYVVTDILEILGGSDLSEMFDISAPEGMTVEPGMVACIDPERPGKLRLGVQAYDKTVVGIVSGAGGVAPGLTMRQEASIASGEYPVALTGRAYVQADASYSAIEPGDLLTTSPTTGHAMRVDDHDRARGAIIGKAMTSLEEGQGLVLVVVSLQ